MKIVAYNHVSRMLPGICLVLVLSSVSTLKGQELAKNVTNPTPTVSEPTVTERVKVLEAELEKQNSKLDQLKKTIEQQQQAIQTLLAKLSDTSPANQQQAAVNSAAITASSSAPIPAESPTQQTPSVEQRLAKVESQSLRIGPLRLSGDFRLRYDGIFRSATEPPDPPLTHLQNSRARYRLRLNLDTDLHPALSFHGQLTTGPVNNPLTQDQDFAAFAARAPIFISEAWIDYHPNKSLQIQGGRVLSIFADNSRFLFDDDVRFNGFNEKYVATLKTSNAARISSVEFRAGQYILSNPNVAIINPGSPLANAGQVVGSTGRSANLFHQGILVNQTFNEKWSSQFGGDIQLYRNPNQIQLSSLAEGVALLVQPALGLTLSGPLGGIGTATTTPGGAIYTAPGFQIARLTFRLNYAGFKRGDHNYPVVLNFQVARNVATALNERDAMLAAAQIGRVTKKADMSFMYVFTIKGANALISQVTDEDLGTTSGVNIRTHHFRFEYGISRKITFQSLFFIQDALRNSGQYPNFFVPLNAFSPRLYRVQQQIVFNF